jgi:hypothetical protein
MEICHPAYREIIGYERGKTPGEGGNDDASAAPRRLMVLAHGSWTPMRLNNSGPARIRIDLQLPGTG